MILLRHNLRSYWIDNSIKSSILRAVVVAQLAEWSLPIPEVRGSNPVIDKLLYCTFTINCIDKTKIHERGREWPNFLLKFYKF